MAVLHRRICVLRSKFLLHIEENSACIYLFQIKVITVAINIYIYIKSMVLLSFYI